jgi:hypothetical protein
MKRASVIAIVARSAKPAYALWLTPKMTGGLTYRQFNEDDGSIGIACASPQARFIVLARLLEDCPTPLNWIYVSDVWGKDMTGGPKKPKRLKASDRAGR